MQHHQRLSSRLAVWRPAPELSQLTPPLSADDSHCQEHCDRHWRPAKVPHACKSLGSLPSPHSVSGSVFVLISPPLPLSFYLSMSATHWVCLSLYLLYCLSHLLILSLSITTDWPCTEQWECGGAAAASVGRGIATVSYHRPPPGILYVCGEWLWAGPITLTATPVTILLPPCDDRA